MAESSFEETLINVWRLALVENASVVEVDGKRYSVRITPRKGLRQVDFVLDGNEIRGLEQNPDTKSRWAQLARSGKKVMQFLTEGRYVAVVFAMVQFHEGIPRMKLAMTKDEA
jgi:hypothetical protein